VAGHVGLAEDLEAGSPEVGDILHAVVEGHRDAVLPRVAVEGDAEAELWIGHRVITSLRCSVQMVGCSSSGMYDMRSRSSAATSWKPIERGSRRGTDRVAATSTGQRALGDARNSASEYSCPAMVHRMSSA